jgi:hypothetical protein
MSEFKFFCPECGQKILGDTAYSGTQVACPTCQKVITIPTIALDASASTHSANSPAPQKKFPSLPPSPAKAASQKQSPDRFSVLAGASLICSVFVPLGAVPAIICGHLAKARMRRNIFLVGEKTANAGLLIGYCVLLATVTMTGVFFLEHRYFTPVKVMRETPEAIAAMQPRVVDDVVISENEDDHDVDGQMQYAGMSTDNDKFYRCAQQGGSFSYRMKVLPHGAMTLNCHYWGGERKNHVFDIAVNNQIIATQDLTTMAPKHFVDVEYKIPASLTRGKTQVKVEFQAHAGMTAGGLYGCQILKR